MSTKIIGLHRTQTEAITGLLNEGFLVYDGAIATRVTSTTAESPWSASLASVVVDKARQKYRKTHEADDATNRALRGVVHKLRAAQEPAGELPAFSSAMKQMGF